MTALTIGMATYDDFDGVYFTVQSLHLHHDLTDTEIVVIDNYGCAATRRFVERVGGRYILFTEVTSSTIPKGRVFHEARGEAVLVCDSHVLFSPDAIAKLKAYYRDHPKTLDFHQGPMVLDSRAMIFTHFEMVWNDRQWGVLRSDPRGLDLDAPPFEIPAHIMTTFSCRRAAWPGFNPRFRGFGGGQGYIHEKIRRQGGRCLCLPFLRHMHRFPRPRGIPYHRTEEEYFRNNIIGHAELGLDLQPMVAHYLSRFPHQWVTDILARTLDEDVGASLALDPSKLAAS